MWIEKGGGRCPPEGYEIVIENASTSKIKKKKISTPYPAISSLPPIGKDYCCTFFLNLNKSNMFCFFSSLKIVFLHNSELS